MPVIGRRQARRPYAIVARRRSGRRTLTRPVSFGADLEITMIRSVSIGLLAYAVSGCFVHAAQPEYFGKWIEDDSTCDKSDTATGLSVGAIEFTEGRRIHFEGSCT